MDEPQTSLEAEKAFSILPMSGVLQPGESQQVSFTFSGHLNTISDVTALCHVEGGPTYEVLVTGEISRVRYSVRPQEINCGLQIFNEIHHSDVTLVNSGKIEFNWVLKPSPADKHLPGVFLVNPTTGSLAPGKKRVLKFSYMPGLPGAFSRTYQLKVGDQQPENICLKGEASFPMISLDLPWIIRGNEKYEKILKQLIKPLQQDNQRNKSVILKKPQSLKTKILKSQTPTTQTLKTQNPKSQDLQPSVLASGTVSDTQLQIKMMRMLMEKAALELQQKLTSHPLKSRFPDKQLCQSLAKVELPQYVLDMGPVLRGYTETRSLKITNPGQIHVSFKVDVSVLQDTGFSVGLDQMICLPPNNSVDFDVRFESANKPYGDVEVLLPIEVTEGPMYSIRIRATVSEVSLTLTKNRLQFSDIPVGQCQVETIQLYNRFPESCKWFIASNKPALKNSHLKFMTPAVRQKLQVLVDEPCPFDVTPSKGTLDPGKWQDLQIQFTPEEERSYKNELEFIICGSSNRLKLHLSGKGLEPRLEFRPPALKMGGMLVDSNGVEATVVVKNPCNFPTESHSLDFDEQYLEEEKILQMSLRSEYQKSFFMPPRAMGETLPPEVLQDHEAHRRPKAQQAELKPMAEAKARAEAKAMGKAAAELQREKALQRKAECILQMDEDEYDALPKEKKAEVDKIILERKRIRREKELKRLAQKQKGKTKPPEKKETKAPEGKETKAPERKETMIPEKKNKPPEKKETKPPEKKEMKILKKATEPPEKKNKPPEKETKSPERKATKIPEKETKAPKKGEAKAPEKGEPKTSKKDETKAPEKGGTKAQKKGRTKAPKKGETEIPEDAAEMENLIQRFQIYESLQQNFSYWNRVQGTVQIPVIQKGNKFQHAAGNKGQKTNKPQEKLTPSAFQKEMSLSTKQRLARAKKLRLPQAVQPQDKPGTSHHKFSAADPEQSSIQPCPPEVVFQNYSPNEVCEVPLVLRNRDKVPHLVKVTMKSSPYFQLVGPNDACRKVPPGLYMTVHILFTPGQKKDYSYELTCTTEREEFIVPIRAIGPRAILDFPAQVDFSECPVKHSTQKTLLVRNVGNRTAHYQLSTQSPFSVIPTTGALDVGDAVQVAVEFQPLKTGDHSGFLVVHYDTGEDTHTSLHGRAVEAPIGLDRNTVTLEKTYISMSNSATVLIHNRSDITARFQWKAVATQEQEDQLRLRQYHRIYQQQRQKLYGFLKERELDITCRERLALLNHTFQSEIAKIRGDPMLLDNDIFSLQPKEGEIRPNCSAEISVFFTPQAAQVYERTVYCDISGRENRLPLLLTGEGLGPQVHFHFEEMNIREVSVRVTHRYEAYLINNGPIEAPFKLIPPTTAMGSCFTFLPQEGIVAPEKLQVIRVSFCPTIRGEFEEEFHFHVTESPKPVTFTVRGSVMGPTFHFDVPALHFGDVAFGFPRTLKCCLFNTSLTPMGFFLYVPGDGVGLPSIDSSTQIVKPSSQAWRRAAQVVRKPREFTISPCSGTVHALGSQDIKVTLCPNTVGEYKLELVLDAEDVGKKAFALPLTARCIVPSLQVLNPVLELGHCCLKVRYDEKVTLVNDSDFPASYCVLTQEHKKEAALWYFSPTPSGIIEAHSSVEIPIELEAQLLGQCKITAKLAVFGSESPLEIRLECVCQGPVVYVHPREINFGSIPVLEDRSKTLHLANQCEIPATFQVEMAGKRSCWRIEPSKGVVPPNSEVSVAVIANLNDTVKFQEKVKVFIQNNPVTIISLQAVGIGTTVVTDKPLVPKLDLKSCFSFSPCFYHFQLTNRGRRTQRLYWSTEGFRTFRRSSRAPAPAATKGRGAAPIPRPGSPVFKVRPVQVDLRPGQTVDMVLEGCSSTVQEVKERLLCHAVVGKEITKKQILQVDVICNFICPGVQMSPRAIAFRVEKGKEVYGT
uniref:hydrocephalus-inducing protein-like n=1 Tax=Agelaius phoeniceus TaxID=39638 RepID=UPI0023EB1765|nr:hydrocephalus-inducing protein-like [Agelaius phoeniceus]